LCAFGLTLTQAVRTARSKVESQDGHVPQNSQELEWQFLEKILKKNPLPILLKTLFDQKSPRELDLFTRERKSNVLALRKCIHQSFPSMIERKKLKFELEQSLSASLRAFQRQKETKSTAYRKTLKCMMRALIGLENLLEDSRQNSQYLRLEEVSQIQECKALIEDVGKRTENLSVVSESNRKRTMREISETQRTLVSKVFSSFEDGFRISPIGNKLRFTGEHLTPTPDRIIVLLHDFIGLTTTEQSLKDLLRKTRKHGAIKQAERP
jgi:hypothetical protein